MEWVNSDIPPVSWSSASTGRGAPGMSVAIVLKTAHGGTWILPHVDELLHRGHRVTVIIPAGTGRLRNALETRDVSIVESPFDFSFRHAGKALRGLAALRRVIRGIHPDVVMYHLYASALAVRLSTLRLGMPRVHMVAGPLYLDSRVIRTAERALARLDSRIIAGSQHTADRYAALGLSSRVSVIPYGVDTQRYTPQPVSVRREVRQRLGIPEDSFLAIMVAFVYAPKRLVHAGIGIKGHDVLLDAWERVRSHYPSARLLLVGAGFDQAGEEHRENLSRERRLDDLGIDWLDTVDDVRSFYAAADVSVSPSLSENHGAALEASASGVPSIVSDAGALPETVTSSSGWVVPRGDPMPLADAVFEAIERARQGSLADMGWAARVHVENSFDNRVTARAIADLLEQLGQDVTRGAGRASR
jgi:glycosyltransferase involved in cell wall biosynthesis